MPIVAKRKSGRRAKDPDPRPQMTARVPSNHRALYEQDAKELGLALTDYLAMTLAIGRGLEVPGYIRDEIERVKRARENQTSLLEAS